MAVLFDLLKAKYDPSEDVSDLVPDEWVVGMAVNESRYLILGSGVNTVVLGNAPRHDFYMFCRNTHRDMSHPEEPIPGIFPMTTSDVYTALESEITSGILDDYYMGDMQLGDAQEPFQYKHLELDAFEEKWKLYDTLSKSLF